MDKSKAPKTDSSNPGKGLKHRMNDVYFEMKTPDGKTLTFGNDVTKKE